MLNVGLLIAKFCGERNTVKSSLKACRHSYQWCCLFQRTQPGNVWMKVEMGLARPVFVCPFVQASRGEGTILTYIFVSMFFFSMCMSSSQEHSHF